MQYGARGKWLLELCGFAHCVNMREDYDAADQGLEFPHHCHPPAGHRAFLDQLMDGVAFIHEAVSQRRRVYVYCKHGKHRSVALVAAYLITQGWEVDEAFARVMRYRVCDVLPFHYEQVKRFYQAYRIDRSIIRAATSTSGRAKNQIPITSSRLET